MMTEQPLAEICFIGLGSNLADPGHQINTARQSICQLKLTAEMAFSSLYNSPPMGPQDQPVYTNAVMQISTSLDPMELLRALQTIENEQGRVRKPGQRWGARTLDLDLLLYGQQQVDLEHLIVPHAGIANRAFVLYPLQEIAPDVVIPGLGDLSGLVANCPLQGLVKIDSK
jgi:2-amino-4-hydroxy-6-hydroxymethyldihydropteridine diphosphokinase